MPLPHSAQPMTAYLPPARRLAGCFADDWLIIAEKPCGLLSVPGRGEHRPTACSPRAAGIPDALTVHRLDMSTSGILVLARGPEMHRRLSKMFQDRQVNKLYVAVLYGLLPYDEGGVDLPLIVDWPNRPKQKVDFDLGRPSQTRFRVLSRDTGKQTTRVALEPVTGRSHQLRVHMMSLQHPILGDDLYGGPAEKMADRLLLHAMDLGFKHPETGERMDFHSEPPF
jgi:tRNA pseudouridine32 synthase/23S rRNA pseudouridine746 synthase